MRRVAWIGAAIAVLAIVFILVKTHTSSRSPSTSERHDLSGSAARRGWAQVDSASATRKVAGTVYLDDSAVPGATVRLTLLNGGPELTAKTDANGRFDLGAVRAARYAVVAEVVHATGAALTIDLQDLLTDSEKLRLIAHACDASLFGVIRDASGGTIANARVSVRVMSEAGPGVDAGDDGSYELCVPMGDSSVMIRADGYADADTPLSAFARMRRDFELVPEAVVAGRAVRAGDGSPVANATLSLSSDELVPQRYRRTQYAMSDDDGRFRFRGVAAGRYSLSGKADHLATLEPAPISAEVAAPANDAVCTLSPTLSISGHVVDKRTKKPVPSQRMTASAPGRSKFAESREDGSFTFEGLLPGVYSVGALSRIRDPSTQDDANEVKLDRDDVDGLTIEIDAAVGSIAGRVTRAGKGVDGAVVQARPAEKSPGSFMPGAYTTSVDDGSYVLRGLAAGSYRLYAESKRVGAFTNGPTVTIGENEDKTGVDVEMSLAGSIAGTVIDQAGAPVGGVHVRFSLLQGTDYGEATTAEDGTFKAAALSGGGDYAYEVRPLAGSPIAFRPAQGTRFAPIAVANADAHVTGVQIKIQFERLSIVGRVVTSDGAGVPDATVAAEQGYGYQWSLPSATTDAAGNFAIKDLPAGKYAVSARSTIASQRVEAVAAGSKNVEIRLPVLGRIDGTLEGFASPPTVDAYSTDVSTAMMPMRYRATVTGSAFAILNVPAGSYSVSAWGKDGTDTANVVVGAKKTQAVVLRNGGIGSVDGTVVDEAHQPVASLLCIGAGIGSTRTNAAGRFHMERVPAGEVKVSCYSRDWDGAADITVERGKTAHVDLIATKRTPPQRGYSGIQLGTKDADLIVKTVASSSPAEHAGVKVGDIIRAINGVDVNLMEGLNENLLRIEDDAPGSTVKLTVEREAKPLTIELTLQARPQAP